MSSPTKRDGFWRPLLGRKRDLTLTARKRPGITVYEIPVYRNTLRRGTLTVTLASYTNGGLSVDSKYVTEPWEEDEYAWLRRRDSELAAERESAETTEEMME